jgi:RNA polymerase sigma factor (sigma-70 family)
MATDEAHPVNDPIIRSIFRHKARQIAGNAGITTEDVEDLEHEIVVHFLHRYKASTRHSARAVACVAADHAIADYLRHRGAQKRDDTFTVSLNTPVTGPDGSRVELGDTVGPEELDARRGVSRRDPADAGDLVLDVAAAVDALPLHLREVAERRRAGDSVTQIAADLGLPRTTVSSRVTKIRRAFQRAGLRDYL